MKILVTGRYGQLAQSLAARGKDQVLLLGRPNLDLVVPGSARSAIIGASPDLVVNAAAYTAVDIAEGDESQAMRINAHAAGEVAGAARELGIPVIHISTDYVFGGKGSEPYTETAPTAPINAYGRTKLAGESMVRAANPSHLILRTSWLVSPFGHNFVRTMVDLGQQRDTLSVVADQIGSPTSAFDLADSIIAIAERFAERDCIDLGQTYHLSGSGIASWFDVAVAVQHELARLGCKSASVTPISTADWPTPAKRPAYAALDSTKFSRAFRITMPEWRVSIGAIVAGLVA